MADVLVGDANGDEKISVLDVIKIQKAILSEEPLGKIEFGTIDINESETITVADALYVMRYIVGNPNCLDVGKIRRLHFTFYL